MTDRFISMTQKLQKDQSIELIIRVDKTIDTIEVTKLNLEKEEIESVQVAEDYHYHIIEVILEYEE